MVAPLSTRPLGLVARLLKSITDAIAVSQRPNRTAKKRNAARRIRKSPSIGQTAKSLVTFDLRKNKLLISSLYSNPFIECNQYFTLVAGTPVACFAPTLPMLDHEPTTALSV